MKAEIRLLVKQNLSIGNVKTIKDQEIEMWINAGIEDLKRQGIKINLENALIQSAIVMYVKSNFGNVDLNEKDRAQITYNLLCNSLGLSSDYKEVDN